MEQFPCEAEAMRRKLNGIKEDEAGEEMDRLRELLGRHGVRLGEEVLERLRSNKWDSSVIPKLGWLLVSQGEVDKGVQYALDHMDDLNQVECLQLAIAHLSEHHVERIQAILEGLRESTSQRLIETVLPTLSKNDTNVMPLLLL